MRILKRSISFILAFAVIVNLCFSVSFAADEEKDFRGFVVNSLDNRDFPSKSNLSIFALVKEIKEILLFAEENQFNSIVLDIRPDNGALYKSPIYPASDFWLKEKGDFTFFDLSKEFLRRASKKNIDVYALVSMEKAETSENLEDIRYLSDKYDFAGIVLKDLHEAEALDHARLLGEIKEAYDGKKVGVIYSPFDFSEESQRAIAENTDFIMPSIDKKLSFRNIEGYIPALQALEKLNNNIIPFSDLGNTADVTPVFSTKHFEALNSGFHSYLLGGYKALKENRNMQMSLISTVEDMKEAVSTIDTGYKAISKFDVTRPAKNISTPYTTYFIMGISDPHYPVYFRGEKLERVGEDGLWGVKVNLNMGNNYFTFSQNGISKSIVIKRYSYGDASPKLIDKITKAFPWDNAIFPSGEEKTLSCIAPAGGRVYAVIDGNTVPMEQAAQAKWGVPALYKGEVTLSSENSEEVKSVGTVEYYLNFNGVNSKYITEGKVYLQGSSAKARVKTSIIFANVLTPELEFGDFKAIYKEGTVDEAVGMSFANNDWYYELKSGGFIKAADVEVLESFENIASPSLEVPFFESADNKEFIIFKDQAGIPYTFIENDDGSTVLSLYGDFTKEAISKVDAFLNDISSTLYSSMSAEKSENSMDITFIPNDVNAVWGLDVVYREGDAVIMTKTKPLASDDIRMPLKNVTIAIDPGHGGIDSGALGVLGIDGPMEKHANLLNAYILRERLENLGARVILTRETNEENPTLLERANTAYDNDADIFISIHHNSIAEAADGNEYHGVETYYYENFGRHLAELISSKIAENNADRDYRKTEWAYYVVTKMRCAPALLAEIGFMPSPMEYERVLEADEIFKTSEAITASILELMQ